MNTLPLFSLLFIHFYFPYLCLSQVFPWSTLHLEAGVVPSLNLSFLNQATPYVEPPSKPPTESDVVVVCSTISNVLSLYLIPFSLRYGEELFYCGEPETAICISNTFPSPWQTSSPQRATIFAVAKGFFIAANPRMVF